MSAQLFYILLSPVFTTVRTVSNLKALCKDINAWIFQMDNYFLGKNLFLSIIFLSFSILSFSCWYMPNNNKNNIILRCTENGIVLIWGFWTYRGLWWVRKRNSCDAYGTSLSNLWVVFVVFAWVLILSDSPHLIWSSVILPTPFAPLHCVFQWAKD